MTGDEMERAIKFLLEIQARQEVRDEQLREQLARTDRRPAAHAVLLAELKRVVKRIADQGQSFSGE